MGAHLDIVWRLASYLTRGIPQAEELVGRCAQLACARRATLVSAIGFKPWFLGLLVETWQQSAPRHLRLVDHGPEASLGDAYALAESAGVLRLEDPARAILGRLTAADICEALSRLPVEDRVVTALSLADDLSYREIGLILAVSAETVRTRLHRGRALLKVAVWELSQAVR
jgi:RNA polymerase sigma-70 factor (ECF subfamily)